VQRTWDTARQDRAVLAAGGLGVDREVKKYIWAAGLFLFNSEIISIAALIIMTAMFLLGLARAAAGRGGV
jgi:hypothetical protein